MNSKPFRLLIITFLSMILMSCSLLDFLKKDKDDEPYVFEDLPEMTNDNAPEVLEGIMNQIDYLIEDYNLTNETDLEKLEGDLLELSWVEKAEVSEKEVVISVKNGGDIIISEASEIIDDDSDYDDSSSRSMGFKNDIISEVSRIPHVIKENVLNHMQTQNTASLKSTKSTLPGQDISKGRSDSRAENDGFRNMNDILIGCNNRKVLIANSALDVKSMIPILDNLNIALSSWFDLFEVDYIQGEDVTVEFLSEHLTDYGLIFLVGHGVDYKIDQWTAYKTGETFRNLTSKMKQRWDNKEIFLYKKIDSKGFLVKDSAKWVLCPKFFNTIRGDFSENSILYAVVCSTLKYDDNMMERLYNKGLGVYIGYDNIVTPHYAEDALNTIVTLLLNPLHKTSSNDMPAECYYENSLDEALNNFAEKECYWNKHEVTHLRWKCRNPKIALFSTISGAEEVNLGLPWNWASCNLGASNPSECGEYYTIGKHSNPNKIYYGNICGNSQTDIVTQIKGGDWQLPSAGDFGWILPIGSLDGQLVNWNLYYQYNGVRGARITGYSGESIFLPYYGAYWGNSRYSPEILYDKGYSGFFPFGQIDYDAEDNDAHIYMFNPSRFRGDVELGGFYQEIGEDSDYTYNFHSNKTTVRGVRPNYFYDKSDRDYDGWSSDISDWISYGHSLSPIVR